MRFLEYTERADGYLVVTTDDPSLPEVAYPIDKFKDLEGLKREVEKKILEISRRSARRSTRREALINELVLDGVSERRRDA